ncbi:MAG: hypothetical protein U5K72_08025 [Balneolaceae bacterium]|nr:hypothetical protein [Balneolaceae bacterium]
MVQQQNIGVSDAAAGVGCLRRRNNKCGIWQGVLYAVDYTPLCLSFRADRQGGEESR